MIFLLSIPLTIALLIFDHFDRKKSREEWARLIELERSLDV